MWLIFRLLINGWANIFESSPLLGLIALIMQKKEHFLADFSWKSLPLWLPLWQLGFTSLASQIYLFGYLFGNIGGIFSYGRPEFYPHRGYFFGQYAWNSCALCTGFPCAPARRTFYVRSQNEGSAVGSKPTVSRRKSEPSSLGVP